MGILNLIKSVFVDETEQRETVSFEKHRAKCWQDVQEGKFGTSVDLRPAQKEVRQLAEQKYGKGSYQVASVMDQALHVQPDVIAQQYGKEIGDACRKLQYKASIEGRNK